MSSPTELYPEFRLLLSLQKYVHAERQTCPMYTDVEREHYRELGVVEDDICARLQATAKRALESLGLSSKPFA
jgi:hypothetical protein